MWGDLKKELSDGLAKTIRERFGVDHAPVLEVPPRRELGDLASPAALQLARILKRKPREIAEELADAFPRPALVHAVTVEGAGYLNFRLDRGAFTAQVLSSDLLAGAPRPGKVIIEHTNINPNKAAHIGHLRNAVLGDVLARCLKGLGATVEVENYIDDTGVQLADVVVGFLDLRQLTAADVLALPDPFDYYCWDLYSEVGQWYESETGKTEGPKLRRQTLHEMETGQGERAEMARLVARRVVHCHLSTMRRLDVGYDLLTRESSILGLRFFEHAFEPPQGERRRAARKRGEEPGLLGDAALPERGVRRPRRPRQGDRPLRRHGDLRRQGHRLPALEARPPGDGLRLSLLAGGGGVGDDLPSAPAAPAKSASSGEPGHPEFGRAFRAINVIDARQSYLQKIVRAGLEALGHPEEAERSIHFAYEMVALSPSTARLLGYLAEGAEDKTLEMSGRKGVGVKADDLIDRLEAKSREEISSRERAMEGLTPEALDTLAHQIAIAALRFFMVKATTNRVIAFDFDEALSFEGESGPYLQYSLVRAKNIRRRLAEEGLPDAVTVEEVARLAPEFFPEDLWDLVLAVAQTGEAVERGADGLELSLVARHALELAQRFNAVYHKHPILQEKDAAVRAARLAAVQAFRKGLEILCGLLAIPTPDKM